MDDSQRFLPAIRVLRPPHRKWQPGLVCPVASGTLHTLNSWETGPPSPLTPGSAGARPGGRGKAWRVPEVFVWAGDWRAGARNFAPAHCPTVRSLFRSRRRERCVLDDVHTPTWVLYKI